MDAIYICILAGLVILLVGLFGVKLFGLGYDNDDDRYG